MGPLFNREGVRVMTSDGRRQQHLAHRGGHMSTGSSNPGRNDPVDAAAAEDADASHDAAMSIDEGIAEAFGAAGRGGPEGILKGLVLWGVPPFQKRVLLAGGANKIFLALAVWVPLFTHQKYQPPDCAAPVAEWPAPEHRGSIAREWGLCCGEEWKLAAINSAYFVGAFVGASCGGVLCDVLGRRSATIGAVIMNSLVLGASALATGPWQYAVARFVTGAANMSAILTNFALGIEWVPERWRPSLAAFFFSCSAMVGGFFVSSRVLCSGCIDSEPM